MLYKEAESYLDFVAAKGRIPGLRRIRALLQKLGQPQKKLTFIQIAGTNGKGSVLSYLSSILKEGGYQVGTFSSPAVQGRREVIQINGTWISEQEYADLTRRIQQESEKIKEEMGEMPSVFEMECAMAFLYFKEKKCEIVVLETGLGGLQDATNIVENTIACVFTSISLDHQNVLGEDLGEIAKEKSGILKKGAVAVSAQQNPKVTEILRQKANVLGCPFIQVQPEKIKEKEHTLYGQILLYKHRTIALSLLGIYQQENAALALETIDALKQQVKVSEKEIEEGMKKATWPGRFSILSKKNPLLIADGAHNPDAAQRLAENMEQYLPNRRRIGIMGVFKDKDVDSMVSILAPYFSYIYTIDLPNHERTMSKETLRQMWIKHEILAETVDSLDEALHKAYENAARDDAAVLAFGSLSYLGQLMESIHSGEWKKGI